MNPSPSEPQQSGKNPWWAYVVLVGFVACMVRGFFSEDLRKAVTLVMTVVGGLGCIFLGSIGVFIFWMRLSAERRYRPVDAIVLSKRVDSMEIPDPEDGPIRVYGPAIEYEYMVGGATYRCGTVMSGGSEMRTGRWVQRVIARFAIGQTVRAYYNDEEPSQAFLVKGDYGVTPFVLIIISSVGLGALAWTASAFGLLLPFSIITGTIVMGAAIWCVRKIRKETTSE